MSANKDISGYLLPDIDRVIHEPARYNIMALLYVIERADFLFVQNQTNMTPGNVSTHVTKLESSGYVSVDKEFVGKKPRTFLKLTGEGSKAFEKYRAMMEAVFTSSSRRRKR